MNLLDPKNKPALLAHILDNNMAYLKSGDVVEETGRNDGTMIEKCQQVWGEEFLHAPYCVMWQNYNAAKVLLQLSGIAFNESNIVEVIREHENLVFSKVLRFSPAVADTVAHNEHNFIPFRRYEQRFDIMKGCYVAFHFNAHGKRQNHFGQFSHLEGNKLVCVEANTSDSGYDDSDNDSHAMNAGLHIKQRSADPSIVWGYFLPH